MPTVENKGESDKTDPRERVSQDFTDCIADYTECVNLSQDKDMSDLETCKMRFHECSLKVLTSSKKDKVAILESDPENEIESIEEQVSEKLLVCIQEYFMCVMNSFGYCMRTYQRCTISVLDQQVRGRNSDGGIVGSVSGDDASVHDNPQGI